MFKASKTNRSISSELFFQLILHLGVFIFYSFDKTQPKIQDHHFAYFLNYSSAAFLINYLLLPKLFYRKKYIQFFLATAIVIGLVIVIEEDVLEQIYFADTKGKTFNNAFFTLLDVLPVIATLSGFKFAWDALWKQNEVEELKATIEESELQFLKSQINPHFLFNNLNNLYSYAIEQSPKTPQIILELSSVLRYMLYECKEAYVPLSKEIEQLENFTRLSELQVEERGKVTFYSPNPDSLSQFQIAPLILIVFIENAFKHSQASQSDNIRIDIKIEVSEDGELSFICKNNYYPISNLDNLSKGIGLANVKKRLDLIYPGKHNLEIKEKDNEYEVLLQIQLSQRS
ncbi:MAG: histidine kinase [Bacteroidia bacterium]|nr:histidine kinase [Bacteroidia bacterium]